MSRQQKPHTSRQEWCFGLAAFRGKAKKPVVSGKRVVFWPWYTRPPKKHLAKNHFGIPLRLVYSEGLRVDCDERAGVPGQLRPIILTWAACYDYFVCRPSNMRTVPVDGTRGGEAAYATQHIQSWGLCGHVAEARINGSRR